VKTTHHCVENFPLKKHSKQTSTYASNYPSYTPVVTIPASLESCHLSVGDIKPEKEIIVLLQAALTTA
jgi:hypothetical protein